MTFEESWTKAETTAFERLKNALGDSDGDGHGYLGYIPEGSLNVWMFTSGGSAEDDIGRLMCDTPLLCVVRFNAVLACRYNLREDAQKWAMRAYKFFDDTNNLHNVGNIQWLELKGHPSEPAFELLANNYGSWTIEIPLELVFATETTY